MHLFGKHITRHRTAIRRFCGTLMLITVFSLPGLAQQDDRPVIGVALSGGGAKGFAHIGVLNVLEEEGIPIEVVTGTSMGAVIGGLYATGYTPDQIKTIAQQTDWQALFNDRDSNTPHQLTGLAPNNDNYIFTFPIQDKRIQLPSGLIDGQNISMLLYRLTLPYHNVSDFRTLPVTFGCIATDLATGEAVLLDQGYLPDAIRASIAIPTIFKPMKLNGNTYIDGGIARSIPAEDARSLGADIVIASDVGEPVKPVDSLKTFLDIMSQSLGFYQRESDRQQIELSDLYIQPDVESFTIFSYSEIEELVSRGEKAARKKLPELRRMIDSLAASGRRLKPPVTRTGGIGIPENDTLFITGIKFQNVDSRSTRPIETALDISTPQSITFYDLEERIERIYKTGLFSQVSYRLQQSESHEGGKTLILNFSYREQDRLGFSLRYDNKYEASLLLGAQFRNNFTSGDQILTEFRVGKYIGLTTAYSFPLSFSPLVQYNTGVTLRRSPLDIFSGRDRSASLEVDQLRVMPSFSLGFFNDWVLETGLNAEFYDFNRDVGEIAIQDEIQFLLAASAGLTVNTLDHNVFPRRGLQFRVRLEITEGTLLSDFTFKQISGNWKTALPLWKGTTLVANFLAGYSSTTALPLHYRYYMGGLTTNTAFPRHQFAMKGHSTQELNGSNIQAVQSDLQIHLGRKFYLQGGWDAAHLSDKWSWNIANNKFVSGFGLTLGTRTIVGPVSLSLSTPDFNSHYALKVDVGYRF